MIDTPDCSLKGDIKSRKPIASLSFDLDDKWSYMKTHGDPGWESLPSYLDVLVPLVLDFLKARDLTVTFFVVGQDAALRTNHEMLKSIANMGHEIGNHSFHHEPWMHLYSHEQTEIEIGVAEEHIEHATGQKPLGFRGPGFNSLSAATLGILAQRGYLYDATTLPNLLAPLARAYYFATAKFSPEQRRQRRLIGGTIRAGLRSIKPYNWSLGKRKILEIPVTTLPFLKFPIHVSYLLCLCLLTPKLGLQYFNVALKLCRLIGVQPSIVLHPTDFLGRDHLRELPFLPGMNLAKEQKMEFVSDVVRRLTTEFTVVTLQQHARELTKRADLRVMEPSFEQAR